MTMYSLGPRCGPGFVALAFATALSGCFWGRTVEEHLPARSGEGLASVVNLRTSAGESEAASITGELLEVREAGIVLLSLPARKLVYVAFTDIRSAEFSTDRQASIGRRGLNSDMSERLRLQSRFPQGITEEVLTKLLEMHGQEEIEVLKPE